MEFLLSNFVNSNQGLCVGGNQIFSHWTSTDSQVKLVQELPIYLFKKWELNEVLEQSDGKLKDFASDGIVELQPVKTQVSYHFMKTGSELSLF